MARIFSPPPGPALPPLFPAPRLRHPAVAPSTVMETQGTCVPPPRGSITGLPSPYFSPLHLSDLRVLSESRISMLRPPRPVLRADPTSPRCAPPLRLPLGSAPTAGNRGDERISRVPCASRPCMPTAEAPVDAGPPSPGRAVAAAFPAVAYGSASTVKGISGLVPFSPACVGGFRPTGFLSTLRPGGYPPRRKTRFWPRGGSPRRRWDSRHCCTSADHPLGSADLARRTQRPEARMC